jgi:hypothetical protein
MQRAAAFAPAFGKAKAGAFAYNAACRVSESSGFCSRFRKAKAGAFAYNAACRVSESSGFCCAYQEQRLEPSLTTP